MSTEAVGMINKYTEFYMPRLLHPGQESTPEEIRKRENEKKKLEQKKSDLPVPFQGQG